MPTPATCPCHQKGHGNSPSAGGHLSSAVTSQAQCPSSRLTLFFLWKALSRNLCPRFTPCQNAGQEKLEFLQMFLIGHATIYTPWDPGLVGQAQVSQNDGFSACSVSPQLRSAGSSRTRATWSQILMTNGNWRGRGGSPSTQPGQPLRELSSHAVPRARMPQPHRHTWTELLCLGTKTKYAASGNHM